jgi:ribosomal protein L37AE/L43A
MPVTLEKIQKDLKDFPYDFQMYCYHEMNGRSEEGKTYLKAYLDMQKGMVDELKAIPEEVETQRNIHMDKDKYRCCIFCDKDLKYELIDDGAESCDNCDRYICDNCYENDTLVHKTDDLIDLNVWIVKLVIKERKKEKYI